MKLKSLLTLGAIASVLTFSAFGCDDDNKTNNTSTPVDPTATTLNFDTLTQYVDLHCKDIPATDKSGTQACENAISGITYYKAFGYCEDTLSALLKANFIDKLKLDDPYVAPDDAEDNYSLCYMKALNSLSQKTDAVTKAATSFCQTQFDCLTEDVIAELKPYEAAYGLSAKEVFISGCFMEYYELALYYNTFYPTCKKETDTYLVVNTACHASLTCEQIENDGPDCPCNDDNTKNVNALDDCVNTYYPD